MKRILLALVTICGSVFADSYVTIPDHWYLTFDKNYQGTNYFSIFTNEWEGSDGLITEYETNLSDYVYIENWINEYSTGTVINSSIKWNKTNNLTGNVDSFFSFDDQYGGSFERWISIDLLQLVGSGELQQESTEVINETLGLLYTNKINAILAEIYTNWFEYVEGDFYPQITNTSNYTYIMNSPLIITNGLIIKQFIYDWSTTTESTDWYGIEWPSGRGVDLIVLDHNSLTFYESFAIHSSPDLIYTTNIVNYITTGNPIPFDSDNDGIIDSNDTFPYDFDNDGISDSEELIIGTDPNLSNSVVELKNLLISSIDSLLSTNNALTMIRDLRVGSQTFGVSNGNATIRMYVDESSDLTSTWSNTQHVLELDIPADADTKFYRFRMD